MICAQFCAHSKFKTRPLLLPKLDDLWLLPTTYEWLCLAFGSICLPISVLIARVSGLCVYRYIQELKHWMRMCGRREEEVECWTKRVRGNDLGNEKKNFGLVAPSVGWMASKPVCGGPLSSSSGNYHRNPYAGGEVVAIRFPSLLLNGRYHSYTLLLLCRFWSLVLLRFT
jgi:hypothetical protein